MSKRGVAIILQVRLPPDLHEALKRLAAEEDRSLNGQIVHLLRQGAKEKESEQ